MPKGDGTITIDTRVDTSGIEKSVPKVKTSLSSIMNMAKKAGAAIAAVFAIREVVNFGKECLELGSDLAEVQNVVDVTFSTMSGKVDEFASSAAKAFGLSETMAKQYVGTFGAMAKAFGFTEQQAYDMSTALTGLTGDVASFYNLSQDEAYTKMKSVFTGETESLKDLGVVMTQAALDQYALANGYGKTTAAMTEQEKVALRFAFIQKQLNLASGDFIRTSDGWANQVRIMQLQVQSLKATIGQGLINIFTPVIKVINLVLEKLATVANAFKAFTELLTGKKAEASSPVSGNTSGLSDLGQGYNEAAEGASSLANKTNEAAKATKKAEKAAKSYLSPLDEISRYGSEKSASEPATGTGSSAGSGAGALGGTAVDFGGLAEGETVIDKVDEKLTKMLENIKKLCDPATSALKHLWEQGLSKLGKFTSQALNDFYKNFLVPVGKWTLGTGIPRFVDALNNGLMKIDFQSINKGLTNLWDVLTPFAVNVGEGLLWFWENVLVPLGTWTANEVVPRFLDTLTIAIDTVNNILDALQQAWQWFWDNVLQPVAVWAGGVFCEVWDSINEVLKSFSDWCAENPETIEKAALVIGSFMAAWAIVDLVTKIGGIVGAASSFINTFSTLSAVAGKTTATQALLGKAISALKSPVGIAVAALGALIAIGVLVWKNWDTIKAKAKVIWGAIKDFFKVITGNIGGFFAGLWEGISETFQGVAEWFKEKFEAARDNVHTAFEQIGEWFTEKYEAITNAFDSVADWFKEKFESARDNVHTAFEEIGNWASAKYEAITGAFELVADWFKEKFESAYDFASDAFSGAGKYFKGIWTKIKDAFGNIPDWFEGKFSKAWEKVKDVFSSGGKVFDGIKDGILNGLKVVINKLIDGINKVVSIPFNGINTALNSLRAFSIKIGPYELTKPFSWLPTISVPQIPKLANGAVIPPNAPFTAILGDQKHGTNIEAPLETIKQALAEVLADMKPRGDVNYQFMAVMNRRVVFDEIIEEAELRQMSSGVNPFELT